MAEPNAFAAIPFEIHKMFVLPVNFYYGLAGIQHLCQVKISNGHLQDMEQLTQANFPAKICTCATNLSNLALPMPDAFCSDHHFCKPSLMLAAPTGQYPRAQQPRGLTQLRLLFRGRVPTEGFMKVRPEGNKSTNSRCQIVGQITYSIKDLLNFKHNAKHFNTSVVIAIIFVHQKITIKEGQPMISSVQRHLSLHLFLVPLKKPSRIYLDCPIDEISLCGQCKS